jgi:predicted Zn-dependent protease
VRAAGQFVFDNLIARFSRIDHPVWNRDVALILDRLQNALALPDLKVTWAIVGNEQINAMATPGGFLIVNAGLLNQFAEFARHDSPSDTARQHARFIAFVASVLAHELGHQWLGHTDELVEQIQRVRARYAGDTTRTDLRTQLAKAMEDSLFLAERRRSRETEDAADRAGALLMLRAGWEIQDAIDLFRWFDTLERQGNNASLGRLTWIRSHPRASAREVSLETYRAQLKSHQATFDDALVLVENNVLLDSAIVMLDRVLNDLPNLQPAAHARAAALHRQWQSGVSVQSLRVRPSVALYSRRFISGIRGPGTSLGNSVLLTEARSAYTTLLGERLMPHTMSNLAVLDAYAGEMQLAQRRADSAAALLPNDVAMANNQGVVRFLAGQLAAARTAFLRAANLRSSDSDPAPLYNLGRTLLALGDTSGAGRAFQGYLEVDDESGWAQEATLLLSRITSGPSRTPATPEPARRNVTTAPSLGGISLGVSSERVTSTLGRPQEGTAGGDGPVWSYPDRGIILVMSKDRRVVAVNLTKRQAGAVDGVRVGDALTQAAQRLGVPAQREGDLLYYDRGGWAIVLRHRSDVIVSSGIALVQ